MHARAALATALLLAGCASAPPPAERDGPPLQVPPNLHRTPDAQPRIEPIRQGGPNKPYEVGGRRYEPLTAEIRSLQASAERARDLLDP